jgi:glycosyltransferase involved in cell wall biosynthesis
MELLPEPSAGFTAPLPSNEETTLKQAVRTIAQYEAIVAEHDASPYTRDADLAAVRASLEGVPQSKSWKITSPLRAAARLFRHVRGKFITMKSYKQFLRYMFVLPVKALLSPLPRKQQEHIKRLLRSMWNSLWGYVLLLFPEHRKALKEFKNFCIRLADDKEKKCFVFESSMPWQHALFQRPQHMALALGELGNPVVYKDHSLRSMNILWVAADVWIVNDNISINKNCVRILLSTYPYPERLLRRDSPDSVLVYDYIDHIDEKISGSVSELVTIKKKMFAKADIIVASAQVLYDEAAASAKGRVVLVPNGVDTRYYFSFTRKPAPPPLIAGFCSRYPKIVGYFGAIAPWLDYELVNALIATRKDLGFIFIGPDYDGLCMNKIAKADNLLLTGGVDYAVLPEYATWFDICWIPFEQGDVAKSTSPLKLFEYFALGKPVVAASDLRECLAFPQVFQGHDVGSFSQSFDKAFFLAKDPATVESLKQLAVANSWRERALTLCSAVQEVIERKCP